MTRQPTYTLRHAVWPDDIALLKHVRETVFVAEQKVPIELEWDEMDAVSEHVLAIANNGDAIGTGRLLPDGHIGRMAVLKSFRDQGVGSAILELILELAKARGISPLRLNAQVTAVTFYQRFGFQIQGAEFLDAGIPHRKMSLKL